MKPICIAETSVADWTLALALGATGAPPREKYLLVFTEGSALAWPLIDGADKPVSVRRRA